MLTDNYRPEERQYGAILADCPWSFRVWSSDTGHGRSAESHYPTMQPDELAALPVASLAAPDCALFMWATMPTLPQALALGEAWGFGYKTAALAWAKTLRSGWGWHFGMGYWTRANVELCLLFTRGRVQRKARNVRQLIVAPVGRHSAKPDEQYTRIEQLVDGPYLELFARQTRPGWDAFGNQIDGRDVREVLA
jgi:N6-adenosine-specific RNA methylase IME4